MNKNDDQETRLGNLVIIVLTFLSVALLGHFVGCWGIQTVKQSPKFQEPDTISKQAPSDKPSNQTKQWEFKKYQ